MNPAEMDALPNWLQNKVRVDLHSYDSEIVMLQDYSAKKTTIIYPANSTYPQGVCQVPPTLWQLMYRLPTPYSPPQCMQSSLTKVAADVLRRSVSSSHRWPILLTTLRARSTAPRTSSCLRCANHMHTRILQSHVRQRSAVLQNFGFCISYAD
jgi:hypothetical protein